MVLYQWWPLTNGPGILAWTLWLWPTMTICWWTLYICTHGCTCVQQTWSLGQHHGIIFCKQINKMMIRWHLKVLVLKCDRILMIYRIPKSLRLMELYGWLLTNDWVYYSCNKFSILCSSRKSRSEVCRMFCFIYWSNIRFLIKQFSLSHS